MKMLRDMVCVSPAKEARISDIIELPEDTRAKADCYGTVLFAGPWCTFIRPGDKVWYESFDHTVGPKETIIIAEGEILARRER